MADDFTASLKTKTVQASLPHSLLLMLMKILKKKNKTKQTNDLDNSFRRATFQEFFAFKNSILQLKWREDWYSHLIPIITIFTAITLILVPTQLSHNFLLSLPSFLTTSDQVFRITSFSFNIAMGRGVNSPGFCSSFFWNVKYVVAIVGLRVQKGRCPNNLWPGL